MRNPKARGRLVATLTLAAIAILASVALASASTVGRLLAAHAPLAPAQSANPGGRIAALSGQQRSEARRGIGRARLVIPSVGVNAPWVSERLNGAQLGVPDDVAITGLWAGGGQITSGAGTVLLDGHVNYTGQGEGALYPLFRVHPGALVGVSTRSGETVWWRTVRVTDALKQALPQSIFTEAGPHRLVIVTCGGVLEPDGHYNENVLLYAKPLPAGPQRHRDVERIAEGDVAVKLLSHRVKGVI